MAHEGGPASFRCNKLANPRCDCTPAVGSRFRLHLSGVSDIASAASGLVSVQISRGYVARPPTRIPQDNAMQVPRAELRANAKKCQQLPPQMPEWTNPPEKRAISSDLKVLEVSRPEATAPLPWGRPECNYGGRAQRGVPDSLC